MDDRSQSDGAVLEVLSEQELEAVSGGIGLFSKFWRDLASLKGAKLIYLGTADPASTDSDPVVPESLQ